MLYYIGHLVNRAFKLAIPRCFFLSPLMARRETRPHTHTPYNSYIQLSMAMASEVCLTRGEDA